MPDTIYLDGSPLHIQQVIDVARNGANVELDPATRASVENARVRLERIATDGDPHYGVNTGFGSLSRHRVDDDHLKELQVNLIRSHAAGVGDYLSEEVTRGMMLILAASLARGLSGVRPDLIDTILSFLNNGIYPAIPSLGSVGASGDLAPLAHLALAFIGEGNCIQSGKAVPTSRTLAEAGINPIQLHAKEGLALINGTHLMAAQAALAVADSERLLRAALVAGAMSIDACKATDDFLDPDVAVARRHDGVATAAARLRQLLAESEILPSHRVNDPRVQDPYSLRCQAPVIGAAISALDYVREAAEQELGAVTDNPLLVRDRLVSAGNFHGMPIALPLDHLALPIAHLAGMAERRVFFMLSGHDPESGLSPYLATRPGLSSGLMIAQYTAAACCNEIIGLCTPASVSNISTSAGIEDYNSFGPRAAAKARRAIELAEQVIAIELLCAAEAIEHHRPLKTGTQLERAHSIIRSHVDRLTDDRPPSPDIAAIVGLIRENAFAKLG